MMIKYDQRYKTRYYCSIISKSDRRSDKMENINGKKIICIGTALVDCIIRGFDPEPVSASGFRADSCSLNAGGEAVNVSVAAARLGLSSSILCFLGNDGAGSLVRSALESSNVDTRLIVNSDDYATPVTTMFVNEDGTRKSVTNTAHRYNFHPDKYTDSLSGADAVILGSLFRAPFDDPEVIKSVLISARAQGALIIADTKLPNFNFLSLSDISDSMPLIDYITPNEDEAKYYSGGTDPQEMADVFLACGVKNIIIKLGSRGCFFKNADESFYLPAFPVKAVDATGAGDNFIAGFTGELLRGNDVRNSVRFANACGAICTTAVGAGTALQSRAQVLEFLASSTIQCL
mgnify:CR=1 FL=1